MVGVCGLRPGSGDQAARAFVPCSCPRVFPTVLLVYEGEIVCC